MLILYLELFKNLCKIECIISTFELFDIYFRVKGKYGVNEKFSFIISLVLFQCIFNAIVSKIILVRETHQDTTPSKMYAFASFTYLLAMLTSNYALEFVSYPMQVKISVEKYSKFGFCKFRCLVNRLNRYQ